MSDVRTSCETAKSATSVHLEPTKPKIPERVKPQGSPIRVYRSRVLHVAAYVEHHIKVLKLLRNEELREGWTSYLQEEFCHKNGKRSGERENETGKSPLLLSQQNSLVTSRA